MPIIYIRASIKYIYKGKYQKFRKFKAFATSIDGSSGWSYAKKTQDEADKSALKACNKHNKSTDPCKLIDQSGQLTVKTVSRPNFLKRLAGKKSDQGMYPAGIKSVKGIRHYTNKYLWGVSNKAFAVRKDGKKWGWAKGLSSLEQAKKKALRLCGKDCHIVDINGEIITSKLSIKGTSPTVMIRLFNEQCLKSAKKKVKSKNVREAYCGCAATELKKYASVTKKFNLKKSKVRKIMNACQAVAALDVTLEACQKICPAEGNCKTRCQCLLDKIKHNHSIYQIQKIMSNSSRQKGILETYRKDCE